MGVEIERKFLVDKTLWQKVKPKDGATIIQGYLQKKPEKTVRIRVKNNTGFITIKGKTTGVSRLEFEYQIPVADAKEMIHTFCDRYIEKTRYIVKYKGFSWEVDEFLSPKKGLILAEIELPDENQEFLLPNWVEKEVSGDAQYYNSNMI